MKELHKLLEKKKPGHMPEEYKNAKMSMLSALRDEMSNMMKDDLSPDHLKKVTVASDNDEGLSKGLDKAQELLAEHEGHNENESEDHLDQNAEHDEEEMQHPGAEHEDGESGEHEAYSGEESPEEEAAEEEQEHEHMSPEELEQEIEKLKALRMKKMMHR